MPPSPVLPRLLAISASAAMSAGSYIRGILASGKLGIVVKGRNDLQTQADRGAQQIITSNLQFAFPGLTVIGEEPEDPTAASGCPREIVKPLQEVLHHCRISALPSDITDAQQENLTVWVDPLDGTSEFAEKLLASVTVLIGIALAGRPVAGVLYQPYPDASYRGVGGLAEGRLVWGLEGVGVFGVSSDSRSPDGFVVTTTRSHGSRLVDAAVNACQPTEVLRVGGCGHKTLLLLDKRAHAYVYASSGSKKWDTCAPDAILRAAGGRFTDVHGAQIVYHAETERINLRGILAAVSHGHHERCLAAMPEIVRRQLPPA